MTTPKILSLVIALLVLSNAFFAVKYFNLDDRAVVAQDSQTENTNNAKVQDFAKLFVASVLKAEAAVDLETRVELENAVRATEDVEIIQKWQDFANSETDATVQKNLKDLIELLVNKI